MVTTWLQTQMTQQLANTNDFFNTKEDAEVLKGLFIGRRTFEQHADIHLIKQLKMFDIL